MRHYEPMVGEGVINSCREAARIAAQTGSPVKINHNGTAVIARPYQTADQVYASMQRKRDRVQNRYYASDEYRARVAKRKREVKECQRRTNAMVAVLPSVAANMDTLIVWLSAFSGVADDCDVTFDHKAVIDILVAAGYVLNAHVGDDPQSFDSRKKLGEWIVGQAISCINHGMGPHLITQMFAEQYFKIPIAHQEFC